MDYISVGGSQISNVISAQRREELNGENTIEFETVYNSKFNSTGIGLDERITFKGQYFDISSIEKTLTSDGVYIIRVSGEHISYRLSDMQYVQPEFLKDSGGKRWQVKETVSQVSVTPSGGSGFTGTVTSVNSKNIPTISINNRGGGYAANDIITIRGSENGLTTYLSVDSISVGGMVQSISQATTPDGQDKKWTIGPKQQKYTSGKGSNFAMNCYYKDVNGHNPRFKISNRGSGYAIDDTIIIGGPNDSDPLASTTVEAIGYAKLTSVGNIDFNPTAVAAVSVPSENASIPDPDTGRIEDDDINVNITGSTTSILRALVASTGFSVSGSFNGFTGNVTFTSSNTSIRQLIFEFLDWVHDEGYTTSDVVFNNYILRIIGEWSDPHVFNSTTVKTLSYNVNKNEKDIDGNYETTYTCEPIHIEEGINLGDIVTMNDSTIGLNARLRVTAITHNPYDELDWQVEVSNVLKRKNISNTLFDRLGKAISNAKKRTGGMINQEFTDNMEEEGGGGDLPALDPSSAGEYLAVDKDGHVVTTQANENWDPLIVNHFLSNETDATLIRGGKAIIDYIETAKISSGDLFLGPNLISSNDWLTDTTNLPKDFILGYGGEGYKVNDTVKVKGVESGAESDVKILEVATDLIASYVIGEDSQTVEGFKVSEMVEQKSGSSNTSGTNFIGIVRSTKDNKPVIAMQSGGTGFKVNDIVNLEGKVSHKEIKIKITAIRTGVATRIEASGAPSTSFKDNETCIAISGGNGAGLKVYTYPYITNTKVSDPSSEPDDVHQFDLGFDIHAITVKENGVDKTLNKRLLSFKQYNKNDEVIIDNVQYNLDLSGAFPEQTSFLGVNKDSNTIRWLPGGSRDYIITDHMPYQSEIDTWPLDTLIFVYDPDSEYEPPEEPV